MTLDRLPDGDTGVISGVGGQGARRLRLLELGLTPGTSVTAVRRAPSGDPIQLLLRGYSLTLRSADAGSIELEAVQ